MAAATLGLTKQTKISEHFYRHELDVLRFIAFKAVFICHGPRLWAGASAPEWKRLVAHFFEISAFSGVYGLCLFFLLSSYLITELLLREQEKTGSVHLKAFYVRRILRIWPLYYLGVAIAIIVGLIGYSPALTRAEILYLVFFVAWRGGRFHFNPMGPLWSISCEELFYAVWPTIAKIRGRTSILVASLVIVPIALTSTVITGWYWYNPVSQFLFFAVGALLALWLHDREFSIPNPARIPAGLISIACWIYVIGGMSWLPVSAAARIVIGQLLVAIACTLLFLALYGCPTRYLPRPLTYLGRISYGLYVFHLLCISLVRRFLVPRLPGSKHELIAVFFEYAFSLGTTVGLAALSFHFFEQPFLKVKQRFTFVRSRE